MKKRLAVEKKKFDAVLGKLIKANPVPRTSVKASGTRGSKKQIPAKQ